jgi:hypothetical protein
MFLLDVQGRCTVGIYEYSHEIYNLRCKRARHNEKGFVRGNATFCGMKTLDTGLILQRQYQKRPKTGLMTSTTSQYEDEVNTRRTSSAGKRQPHHRQDLPSSSLK